MAKSTTSRCAPRVFRACLRPSSCSLPLDPLCAWRRLRPKLAVLQALAALLRARVDAAFRFAVDVVDRPSGLRVQPVFDLRVFVCRRGRSMLTARRCTLSASLSGSLSASARINGRKFLGLFVGSEETRLPYTARSAFGSARRLQSQLRCRQSGWLSSVPSANALCKVY